MKRQRQRQRADAVVADLPPLQAAPGDQAADWTEIERVAALAPIPGADIHNTFVHICRALVEMTAK